MALEGSVSRRYAKALMQIGLAGQNADQLGKQLEQVATLFTKSKDLQQALTNPIFPVSQRQKVLTEIANRLSLAQPVRNFLMLITERGRIHHLPMMARELSAMVDQHAGRVRATLSSARAVSDEVAQQLKSAIEKRTGKQVILDRKEDATLIGGLVTKVGDLVYDGSIRTQLELAKAALLGE